jgi:hypothetical protein
VATMPRPRWGISGGLCPPRIPARALPRVSLEEVEYDLPHEIDYLGRHGPIHTLGQAPAFFKRAPGQSITYTVTNLARYRFLLVFALSAKRKLSSVRVSVRVGITSRGGDCDATRRKR